MRNVSNKSCRENENGHFLSSTFPLLPLRKSCPLWDNVEKYGGDREAATGIWRRVTYWTYRIKKATRAQAHTCVPAPTPSHTHTHSPLRACAPTHTHTHTQKHVTVIAFSQQHLFRERASVLVTRTLPFLLMIGNSQSFSQIMRTWMSFEVCVYNNSRLTCMLSSTTEYEFLLFVCASSQLSSRVTYYGVIQHRPCFAFLSAFVKLRQATVSCSVYVCLSVCQSVSPLGTTRLHWTDFHDIWCLSIVRKYIETIKVSFKSYQIKVLVHEDLC
jgi:hypothetical protein